MRFLKILYVGFLALLLTSPLISRLHFGICGHLHSDAFSLFSSGLFHVFKLTRFCVSIPRRNGQQRCLHVSKSPFQASVIMQSGLQHITAYSSA